MQYIYVVNPIPEKVFCDFTCILHSPLKINALECVGKVCKKTTYTLYPTHILLEPLLPHIHIKLHSRERLHKLLYINILHNSNVHIQAFTTFVLHRSTIKLHRSTMVLHRSTIKLRRSTNNKTSTNKEVLILKMLSHRK